MVKLPSNKAAEESGLNVNGAETAKVLPLMVSLPCTSKRLVPNDLTLVETNLADGKALALNQSLPTTSSSASLLPVSNAGNSDIKLGLRSLWLGWVKIYLGDKLLELAI